MNTETKKGFSRAFWIANIAELLERGAYYGVFIVITLYLSRILSFNDIEAGYIAGIFSAGLYFLPPFSGGIADKIGFKGALLIAFVLLTIGYFGMGIFPVILEKNGLVNYGSNIVFNGLETSYYRWFIIPIMIIIMIGGSFIKSVITGTVAKETTESNRAKGFSIFYMMVNIGAFSGKTIVAPLRKAMGDIGLINLNYFAAGMTFLAFILVFFFYHSMKTEGKGKSLKEIWDAFVKVLLNYRLVILILIVSGFWIVQHQLYATMPKYVLRMVGEDATPSWYANVNPLIVVLTVAFVTQMMRSKTPLFSMTIGMFIMPLSALTMASGNFFHHNFEIFNLSLHPVAVMMILGIVLQALAESFISPRFLEFFSLQAPKGEEGLYLGFSHLHSFVSSLIGFIMSGYLLDKYCPEPKLFATHEEWQIAAANAHYIWYYFAVISFLAGLSLLIFGKVTRTIDKGKLVNVK